VLGNLQMEDNAAAEEAATPGGEAGGGEGALHDGQWACAACTFHNVATSRVCEICGTASPVPAPADAAPPAAAEAPPAIPAMVRPLPPGLVSAPFPSAAAPPPLSRRRAPCWGPGVQVFNGVCLLCF